jgi:hypothetical protein
MRERARERLAGHRSDSTARMLSSQGGRGVQAGACGTNAACTADGSRDRPRTSISLSPVVALDAVVATSTLKGGPRTAVDVWSPDAETLFYRYFTTKLLQAATHAACSYRQPHRWLRVAQPATRAGHKRSARDRRHVVAAVRVLGAVMCAASRVCVICFCQRVGRSSVCRNFAP